MPICFGMTAHDDDRGSGLIPLWGEEEREEERRKELSGHCLSLHLPTTYTYSAPIFGLTCMHTLSSLLQNRREK